MNDPRPSESGEQDEVWDERLSELYRAIRDAEPPAWLDQRILTAARTAVEPCPAPAIRWLRRRGVRFWAAPVALAATVVLAVGLLRGLPPAGEPGEMPTAVEEKTASSLARPAAELNAGQAKNAGAAVVPPAAPSAAPPAKPAEQRFQRPKAMSMEPVMKSESLQAAPARQPTDKEAASIQKWTDRRSPAAWRAEIAELRRQGRSAEAEARLAEFRRQYPDEPLDEVESPR